MKEDMELFIKLNGDKFLSLSRSLKSKMEMSVSEIFLVNVMLWKLLDIQIL